MKRQDQGVPVSVGEADVFERRYTQSFRTIAAAHGEFVQYERDRGARDLGVHLTRRAPGGEVLAPSLAWFQLKGIMKRTLPKEKLIAVDEVKLTLDVRHLRYWYLQGENTYLAVYVESLDRWLVLELRRYVHERWGMGIFGLDQVSVQVAVPLSSVLDELAFFAIRRGGEVARWSELTGAERRKVALAMRDDSILSRAGRDPKKWEHSIYFLDWNTKSRAEVHFRERRVGEDKWTTFHEHWQQDMRAEDLVKEFPYLELDPLDPADAVSEWEKYDDVLPIGEGRGVRGTDQVGEAVEFFLRMTLNDEGQQMADWIRKMKLAGIREDVEERTLVSQASWNARAL